MSSRKAARPPKGGAVPATSGFIGFSAFAGSSGPGDGLASPFAAPDSPASPAPAPSAEPFYTGDDAELAQIMRRLQKRDVTTKLKALQELSSAVPTRDRAVLRDLLPAFSYQYINLALHNDRRVRAGAHGVLSDLVDAGMRKSFAPHLPKMLPYWWACNADPAREVSSAADAAFTRMFPSPPKRLEALAAFSGELVGGLALMLSHGPEELSDMRVTTPEEATERQERVHTTVLDALAALLRLMATPPQVLAEANEASAPRDGVTTASAAPSSAEASGAAAPSDAQHSRLWRAVVEELSGKAVWRKCGDKTPQVRRAAYRLLAAAAAHAPHIIAEAATVPPTDTGATAPAVILMPRAFIVTHALGAASGDAIGSNQSAAWDALLSLSKHLPAVWGAAQPARGSSGGADEAHWQAVVEASARHAFMASACVLRSAPSSPAPAPTSGAGASLAIPPPVDLPKAFWPKLWGCLKHGGYGSPDSVYRSLLPLLASMPARALLQREQVQEGKGGKKAGAAGAAALAEGTFAIQLLRALWSGLRATGDEALGSPGQRAMVQAFSECALLLVTTLSRGQSDSDGDASPLAAAVATAAGDLLCALPVLALGGSAPQEDASGSGSIFKEVASSGGAAPALASACAAQFALALRRLGEVSDRRESAGSGGGSGDSSTLSAVIGAAWLAMEGCCNACLDTPPADSADNDASAGDAGGWLPVTELVRAVLDAFSGPDGHVATAATQGAGHSALLLRSWLTSLCGTALSWLQASIATTEEDDARGAALCAGAAAGLHIPALVLRRTDVQLGDELSSLGDTLSALARALCTGSARAAALFPAATRLSMLSHAQQLPTNTSGAAGNAGQCARLGLEATLRECIGAATVEELAQADAGSALAGLLSGPGHTLQHGAFAEAIRSAVAFVPAFRVLLEVHSAHKDEARVADVLGSASGDGGIAGRMTQLLLLPLFAPGDAFQGVARASIRDAVVRALELGLHDRSLLSQLVEQCDAALGLQMNSLAAATGAAALSPTPGSADARLSAACLDALSLVPSWADYTDVKLEGVAAKAWLIAHIAHKVSSEDGAALQAAARELLPRLSAAVEPALLAESIARCVGSFASSLASAFGSPELAHAVDPISGAALLARLLTYFGALPEASSVVLSPLQLCGGGPIEMAVRAHVDRSRARSSPGIAIASRDAFPFLCRWADLLGRLVALGGPASVAASRQLSMHGADSFDHDALVAGAGPATELPAGLAAAAAGRPDALPSAIAHAMDRMLSDAASCASCARSQLARALEAAPRLIHEGVSSPWAAAVVVRLLATYAAQKVGETSLSPVQAVLTSLQSQRTQKVDIQAEASAAVAALRPDEEATEDDFERALELSVQPAPEPGVVAAAEPDPAAAVIGEGEGPSAGEAAGDWGHDHECVTALPARARDLLSHAAGQGHEASDSMRLLLAAAPALRTAPAPSDSFVRTMSAALDDASLSWASRSALLQCVEAKSLPGSLLARLQSRCAAGIHSAAVTGAGRDLTGGLPDLLAACEAVATALCASPTEILPAFRAGCWLAVTACLAQPVHSPAVLTAARLVPALALLDVVFLQRTRERLLSEAAASQAAWRAAVDAASQASQAQRDAMKAAADAVDNDEDGIDVDAPPARATTGAASTVGAPVDAGSRAACDSTEPYFPLPLPPAAVALLCARALSGIVLSTSAYPNPRGPEGSAWDGLRLACAEALSRALLATWSQRRVGTSESLVAGLCAEASSAAQDLTRALAPVASNGLEGPLDVSSLAPSATLRALFARTAERVAGPVASGSCPGKVDGAIMNLVRGLVATARDGPPAPVETVPEAPAAFEVVETALTEDDDEAAAAGSGAGGVASTLFSAGRSLLSSLMSSVTGEEAPAPAPEPVAAPPPPPPAPVAPRLFLQPQAETDEAGSVAATARESAAFAELAAVLPTPSSSAGDDAPSTRDDTGSAAAAAPAEVPVDAPPLSAAELAAAAATRGAGMLPGTLVSALRCPGLHLRTELGVDALCDLLDAPRSSASESELDSAPSLDALAAEAAFRCTLVALRHSEAAETPGHSDAIGAFLSAAPQSGSSGGGGGLSRVLTAALHLLVHQEGVREAARKEGDHVPKEFVWHHNPTVATLLELALALVVRVADAFPLRFTDIVGSLARGMQLEVERFVAKHVTPALFTAQMAGLRAASSAAARAKAAAKEDDGLDVPRGLPEALAVADLATGLHGTYRDLQCIPGPQDGAATGASRSLPQWDPAVFKVKCTPTTRDVIATYTQDEATLQIRITLPPTFPLKRVTIACDQRMGVTEERWKRWELQIRTLLSTRDGTLIEALDFWRGSIEKEFEGVEPCPICYSAIHLTNHQLPRLCCPTCKNKFHSECLNKWWQSSHESKCPMCRQAFR